MKTWVLPTTRNAAYRMVAIPTVINLTISFFIMLHGTYASSSALLGGLVWSLPNLYFAYKAFSNMRPDATSIIVKNFYVAELYKLALTGLLAVLVLKYIKVSILFFFMGYVISQITFWLTPLLLNRVKQV